MKISEYNVKEKNTRDLSRTDLAHMVTNLRKELKEQIEENKELLKINEEHKKLNGDLRKENDALITVIDLAKNYMKENSKISLDDSVSIINFYKDLLEILERVNESEGD